MQPTESLPSTDSLRFRGKILALDGIRGLAVTMVLLSHFLLPSFWSDQKLYVKAQAGWLGVDLFFVLSGFLITGILVDMRESPNYWSRFYKHRVLRIFPLYFLVVTVVWLTVVFIEKAPERLQGYDSFKWFFTFTPNIAASLKNNWLYHSHIFNLNHLWSLAVEEQFYIVWPLIVRFTPKKWLLGLCFTLVAISTSLREWTDAQVGEHLSVASYVLPFTRMDGLAVGSFIAVFLRLDLHHFVPFTKWVARLVLLWAGWELLGLFETGTEHRLYTLSALTFGSLLYLSMNTDRYALVRRVCETQLLRHLGKYSYGLYIFHLMFEYQWLGWFGHDLEKSNLHPMLAQSIYVALAFLGTYILARISWVLIEQPFLKMK